MKEEAMAAKIENLEDQSPIVTFHASATSTASPEDVYEILADPSTHIEWAGKQAPNKAFKLLTLDASKGRAEVGTTWASTGSNSKSGSMVFHDRSVVTEAAAPNRFAFVTDAHLERKRRKTWDVRFVHRYEVHSEGDGSRVTYEARVYPVNYRPYWLHPLMRPVTKKMVKIFAGKHMANLARMAEKVSTRGSISS
jgi:uncharacterized protein YndB with AHSA1/START domain